MNGAGLVLVLVGVWVTCQVLIAKPSLVTIIESKR